MNRDVTKLCVIVCLIFGFIVFFDVPVVEAACEWSSSFNYTCSSAETQSCLTGGTDYAEFHPACSAGETVSVMECGGCGSAQEARDCAGCGGGGGPVCVGACTGYVEAAEDCGPSDPNDCQKDAPDCSWNAGRNPPCWRPGNLCTWVTNGSVDPAGSCSSVGCTWVPAGTCYNSTCSTGAQACGQATCTDSCGERILCGNVPCCTANSTSVSISPGSPVGIGQPVRTVTPTNTAGAASNLSVSPDPQGWSVSGAVSGTAYTMDLANATSPWPLSAGGADQTYTVTASVPLGTYCASSNTAAITCTAASPILTPVQPSGSVSTVNPTQYSWNTTSWGMDSCGVNIVGVHDGLSADSVQVRLYSGSCSGRGSLVAQNASCPTASPCSLSATLTAGNPYNWDLIADNGARSQTWCTDFTYSPNAGPWWQVGSGHVYGGATLGSNLPPSGVCSGNACAFDTDAVDLSAGVVQFAGSTPTFNGGVVSSSDWLSQAAVAQALPSFSTFRTQAPVVPTVFTDPSMIQSEIDASSGSEVYLEYGGSSATLTIPSLSVGDKKVVIFVAGGASTTNVVLSDDITVNHGRGFFGLVTGLPVSVGALVTKIDGLIFTDSDFSTTPSNLGPDTQLVIEGMVIAKGGVPTNGLGRDLGGALNNTTPAERFVFAPDFLFTLPRALRRIQYQLNEVPPS